LFKLPNPSRTTASSGAKDFLRFNVHHPEFGRVCLEVSGVSLRLGKFPETGMLMPANFVFGGQANYSEVTQRAAPSELRHMPASRCRNLSALRPASKFVTQDPAGSGSGLISTACPQDRTAT